MLNTFIRLLTHADGQSNKELIDIVRAKLKNNKHAENKNTDLSKRTLP